MAVKKAGTETIIIVDDDPADALFAMQLIKKHRTEYDILFLDEGNALLRYFNDDLAILPKAIFLDMHMPCLNGIDVLRKLKRIEQAMHIPVIMLTGSRCEHDITESYRLGATGYIIKPLDEYKFLGTLDNLAAPSYVINHV